MATLELGCGKSPTPGAVHHDLTRHADHVDVAHDLHELPWPWPDESYDKIIAVDVFEHLKPWLLDVDQWLNECWRILKMGGDLVFRVPNYASKDAHTNPTHYKTFTSETFDFWDLSTYYGREFGSWMYARASKWWHIIFKSEMNGQLHFALRKVVA